MLKNKIIVLYRTGEDFVRRHFTLILSIVILLIVIPATFALQNHIVGWEKGYDELQPKHHGSVSSKTLAIISTATQENHFVGYAIRYKNAQGDVEYDYFDRYPVFFSALFNRVLELRPKLSSQLYLARQVMNVIFVATLLVAFLLLEKLTRSKPLALAATLLAFSNPFLLFYKDMVHFDQPALFGFLLLTYAIALYKVDGLKWPVYAATFIAIALGRGYASYAVLLLWLALEAWLALKERGISFGQKVKAIIRHPAFVLTILGIVWGAALLSYNIMIEARVRNIPILETSIVDSAGRRLSFNPAFNEQYEHIINWGEYAQTEIDRIIQWTFPINRVDLGFIGNTLLLGVMFVIMAVVIRRQPIEKRIVYWVLALSGFVWLIPMRNLAAFHDYTTMYFIGVPLVLFTSILVLLKPSKDAAYYLAIMGLVVYLGALTQVRDLHDSIVGNASEYTYDFMRILDEMDGAGNNVYVADTIPYGTNALEFYLSDQYIAPLELSDYVISGNENYLPNNLTPGNRVMFLFKK